VLLEVSVPDAPVANARVRLLVTTRGHQWVLDESPEAEAHWDREIEARQRALEQAAASGNSVAIQRLRAELEWLGQLRKAEEPVLEPAEDGQEAR